MAKALLQPLCHIVPGNVPLAEADCMDKPCINAAWKYIPSMWKELLSYTAEGTVSNFNTGMA